jgi:predicted Zn finger-like uncharacterized protein
MIVTCPSCAKRYMLDDVLLPKEGRQVRCVACLQVWRQLPDTSSSLTSPPFLEFPNMESSETRHFSKKRSRWIGLTTCLAIFLSLISGLVLGRNLIVSLWPASKQGYALVGLPIVLPGAGLSLSNITAHLHQEGATEMILIMGDVGNLAEQARPIPPLKIKLVGEANHVQDHWEHRLSERELLPGEHIHFETAPRPKAAGTQYVTVEF